MTSHPPAPPGADPSSTWRGLTAGLILLLVALTWWALSTPGPSAGADEDSPTVSAPSGFSDTGVVLAGGTGGPQVTIYTDLTCPSCQDLFDDNAAPLRELVEDGTHDVTLVLTHARATSATNETAITRFVDLMDSPSGDPLAEYLVISGVVTGLADDADQGHVDSVITEALLAAGLFDGTEQQVPTPTEATWDWLSARTVDMRQSVGVVPSITVDDRQVSIAELARVTGHPFS